MMRWWWFGPAVTPDGLEREMRLMREGGLGGFEVQPVYPLDHDDAASGLRNLRYLSLEFLDALRFAAAKARELGLRFDLTLGSGWPYGGPQVPVARAASQLRWVRTKVVNGHRRVPLPDISTGEKLIAIFPAGGGRELIDVHDGAVWLPSAGKPPAEVWFFVHSRTGQMVKRAACGAEGFVLDHYDAAALDHYLAAVGAPLLDACGEHRPFAIFCDSLEVYHSDWTGDFLAEFERRRGYDLRPHLPAMVEGLEPTAHALRCDWGRTLTELLEEKFLAPLRDWAHARGTRFRLQCYGTPPAVVSSNAFADLNEGEGTPWRHVSACRLASSGAHLLGRTIVSSETWTWLNSPSFRASPLDLKAEADLHFLQGINQLIGHGWPYSPDSAGYPGWRFYAAGVFNHRNPWWLVMPEICAYLQRVSFLLRSGRPANDVAFHLSNADGWSAMEPGNVDMWKTQMKLVGSATVAAVLAAGYGFDFCDDRFLADAEIDGDALVMGGNRYRIVFLPGVSAMPPATARKLAEFAARGGRVVAANRLPETAPGFLATAADKAEVRDTMQRVVGVRFASKETEIADVLRAALPPDVALEPTGAAENFGFVHRTTADAEIYFLANTGNTRLVAEAAFRVPPAVGGAVEWWNAHTGETCVAEVRRADDGRVMLSLDLAPYESRIVVFSRSGARADNPAPAASSRRAESALAVQGPWSVRFGGSGAEVRMDALRSWTEDEGTRYFSGIATYKAALTIPPDWLHEGARVWLDFGSARPAASLVNSVMTHGMRAALDAPVREAAVVFVNGRRAGAVWCSPYELDVTAHVRAGETALRIDVANLAVNHMAGHALPDHRLLSARFGERFQAQDMDRIAPEPAGLLGPIRLVQR